MKISKPSIILAQPQLGENIGAVARAMMNFGLTDLRLVNPRDGWPNDAAVNMAAGAFDFLPEPKIFDRLQEAISDLNYIFATTARRRDMVKPVYTPRSGVKETLRRAEDSQKTGFVFGRERTGLENDDLALCHAIIHSPTNPDFSSLNLGQCTLLIAYEWFLAQNQTIEKTLDTGDSFPVTHDKQEEFFCRLEYELEDAHFFRSPGLKPTMIRNIRNMLIRAELTDQEVRTFHGIISALTGKKAALKK